MNLVSYSAVYITVLWGMVNKGKRGFWDAFFTTIAIIIGVALFMVACAWVLQAAWNAGLVPLVRVHSFTLHMALGLLLLAHYAFWGVGALAGAIRGK